MLLLTARPHATVSLMRTKRKHMPRIARTVSSSGVYHVVMRGAGRQIVFETSGDYEAMLQKISQLRDDGSIAVLAWCLMSNHVHLLLREEGSTLGEAMKRLGISYAMRFNLRTGHVGHVFQDRYRSEPVEDDPYLLSVVRYIHDNPVKAGIAARDVYQWSSYQEYVGNPVLCDTSLVLDMVGGPRRFVEFSAQEDGTPHLDYEPSRRRLGDAEALNVARALLGPNVQAAFQVDDRGTRDALLRKLRDAGISIRQAERITGIGRKTISTAYRK